eukprot:scpid79517/ scgid32339/ 
MAYDSGTGLSACMLMASRGVLAICLIASTSISVNSTPHVPAATSRSPVVASTDMYDDVNSATASRNASTSNARTETAAIGMVGIGLSNSLAEHGEYDDDDDDEIPDPVPLMLLSDRNNKCSAQQSSRLCIGGVRFVCMALPGRRRDQRFYLRRTTRLCNQPCWSKGVPLGHLETVCRHRRTRRPCGGEHYGSSARGLCVCIKCVNSVLKRSRL